MGGGGAVLPKHTVNYYSGGMSNAASQEEEAA